MALWSRRDVLAALATTAAAPGWLSLLGCGGAPAVPVGPPAPPPVTTVAQLRETLRQVERDLAARFRAVSLRAELGQTTRILVGPEERAVDQRGRAHVALAGVDGAAWIEEVATDLTSASILGSAEVLAARGPAARRGGAPAARPAGSGAVPGPRLGIDPRARPLRAWFDRVVRLYDRAARVGGSRVIYRTAALEVDDGEVLFVGGGRELSQRLVRTRARVLFLAWTGSAIAAEEAGRAGAIGLEATQVPDGELAAAAAGALTLLTGGPAPAGVFDLHLDPSVTALLVRHGAARGFEADAWARGDARAASLEGRPGGAAILTLRDDPTAAGAYGGYRFDDEGWPAAPAVLVDGGVVRGPLCDAAGAAALRRARTGHGRRSGPFDPAEPRPSHLVLSPGDRTRDELTAAIDGQGYLVEGGIDASGDPSSWRVAVRARRAREITAGRLTGRVYGPVVVIGDVPSLLGAARALGRDPAMAAWREPLGSGELAMSVSAPAVVTRGWLGGH